jgi:hypothetical protein
VVKLHSAGNGHEACVLGGGKGRLLGAWRGVDDGNVDTCLFRLLQCAVKTCGLGIHDNWRIGLSRPFGQECDCLPASTLIDGTFRKLTCRKIMLINNL